jgi:hypothetical protein
MKGGVENPLWIVASGTVMAYPAFLPPLGTVRHYDPSGIKARDVRFGYILAVAWSFTIATVVASDEDPTAAIVAWLLTSGLMLLLYELALRSSEEIREGETE